MFVWLVLLISARYIHSDVIVLNDREFEKLGCFAQDFAVFDAILLQNRDPATPETFIGPLLDWNAFPASLHNLLVQCANASKDYNYIAATNFGECWVSNDETTITEFLLKPESEDCLNSEYQVCNIEESCVGMESNQYIYKIYDLLPEPVNGGFTLWSEFNECSKTCGYGIQTRKRTCTNPSPANNGLYCIGENIETKSCNMANCLPPAVTPPPAVDGGFTLWSEFNECSETCGDGVQSRERTCTNPSPENNGLDCIGEDIETKACNNATCLPSTDLRVGKEWQHFQQQMTVLTAGQAGVWGIDKYYHVYCRGGTYVKSENMAKPRNNVGFSWKKIESDFSMIYIASGFNIVWAISMDHLIYIREISRYQPYGHTWALISGSLKQISVNSRTNEVWGVNSDGVILYRQGITAIDNTGTGWVEVNCPTKIRMVSVSISGVWCVDDTGRILYRKGTRDNNGIGSDWLCLQGRHASRISIGYNILYLIDLENHNLYARVSMDADNPLGNDYIEIEGSMTSICVSNYDNAVWGIDNNNLVSHRTDTCLVDIGYSPWSNYDHCNRKCNGAAVRWRYCIPKGIESNCAPPYRQSISCGPKCEDVPVVIHGRYTRWSSFSKCSKSCGGGIKTRTRHCSNPLQDGSWCEKFGKLFQKILCNTQRCPTSLRYYPSRRYYRRTIPTSSAFRRRSTSSISRRRSVASISRRRSVSSISRRRSVASISRRRSVSSISRRRSVSSISRRRSVASISRRRSVSTISRRRSASRQRYY